VYVGSIGTPISAFLGVLAGNFFTRRGAKELETRSRREEVLRNLRWASELAVDADERKAALGVAQLNALADSDLLDESQQLFVDAALETVIRVPLEELAEAGEDAQVVELVAMTDEMRAAIESWTPMRDDESGEDGG
jgi:hypothetical protein